MLSSQVLREDGTMKSMFFYCAGKMKVSERELRSRNSEMCFKSSIDLVFISMKSIARSRAVKRRLRSQASSRIMTVERSSLFSNMLGIQ